jgi:hypothetical protein
VGIFNFLNRSVKKALGAREQQNGTRGRTIERLRTRQGEVRGHRGSRSVSRRSPQYEGEHESGVASFRQRAENYLTTPEGIEIPRNEVNEFLFGGSIIPVASSNVGAVQYDAENRIMRVQFLKTALPFAYSDVSLAEAESFISSASKGQWVWDNLRVRGSSTRHKKPFAQMAHGLVAPSHGNAGPLGE